MKCVHRTITGGCLTLVFFVAMVAQLVIAGSESGTVIPLATWTEPVTGMEFVWVPEGRFLMGTPPGEEDKAREDKKTSVADPTYKGLNLLVRAVALLLPSGCVSTRKQIVPEESLDTSDERPVHPVGIGGFWIGRTEVTQQQWTAIMKKNPSYFGKKPMHPVESVSWKDVQGYIRRLNEKTGLAFRLPTEEEWEYAARSGGKPQLFSGGSEARRFAWYRTNTQGATHQVATREPNGLGIYDMSGNVWEWCKDEYIKDQYQRKVTPDLETEPVVEGRVCRGGCYLNTWPNIRCSNRNHYQEDYGFLNLGFRLVRD